MTEDMIANGINRHNKGSDNNKRENIGMHAKQVAQGEPCQMKKYKYDRNENIKATHAV